MKKLIAWVKSRKRQVRLLLAGLLVVITASIHLSADRIRERVAYLWGTFTAAAGALSLGDVAIYVGIICTIGSFLVTWFYKWKDDKRKDAIFRKGRILDDE